MKIIYQITLIALFGIFAAIPTTNAQLIRASLESKIDNSSLIVEGTVVHKESYYAPNGEVYTANEIAISSALKGQPNSSHLTITTWGGETETEFVTWSHMLSLGLGEKGVLFLEPSKVPETSNSTFPSPAFDVHAGQQGFLKYEYTEAKALVASEPFNTYHDVPNEVFAHIEAKTGEKRTHVSNSSESERSGIRYFINVDSVVGTTVHFKVNVNTLYSNRQLHNAGAVLEYNSDCFGTSVATSGNLQIQTSGISTNTAYSLTKSDITESKVKIEAETVGSVTNLSTITTSEQVLAKGSMTVLDIFEAPEVTFDVADMYELSKYYEGGVENEFDTIIVETDFDFDGFFPAMKIDSIRPLSLRAGVGDVLTIYGCEFGEEQEDSEVFFSDASVGPNQNNRIEPLPEDYLLWSDNVIRVVVPTVGYHEDTLTTTYYGGSGPIWVKVGNSTKKSSEDLTVRFAAINRVSNDGGATPRRKAVRLSGTYGEFQGNTLYYDSTFSSLAGAKGAFERALCTWVESDNINFRIRDYDEIGQFYKNFACGIFLTEDLPGTVQASTKAVTTRDYSNICKEGDSIFFYVTRKFDIFFKKSVDWYTDEFVDPGNDWEDHPDLQAFSLHELGHAQLLLHVNQINDIMWWEIFGAKRSLQAGDEEGGDYIFGISSVDGPDVCTNAMSALTDCGLINSHHEALKNIGIEISPNPTSGFLTIRATDFSNDLKVRIYDGAGKTIYSKELEYETVLDLNGYPSGLLFLNISDSHGSHQTFKIIKK